ncbi:ribose-5-phosphate isomerase rki1, variant 2 [Balamuthia mandrillaris]
MKKGVQRVLKSCSNCRRAHAACDEGRPCRRCITTNQQSTCKDLPPRKRGRKAPAETNQGSSSDGFEAPASSSPTTSVSSAKRPKKRNVSAAAANDQTSASSSSSASSTVQYEDGAPPFLISHFYSRSPLPEDDSNNSNSNVKPTQSPPPYSHFTPSPSPPPPASFSSSSSSAVASPFQPMMEPPHGTQLLSLQPTLPPQQPSPQQQLAIMDPQILLQQMENMRQSFTSITEQLVAGQRQLQEEVEQLRDILFFRHSSSTTSTSPSRLSHRHQQHSITYHQMNNNNSSNNNGGLLRLTLEEEAREESSTSSPSSSSPPQTSFTSSSPADFPPSYPSPQPPSYHHPSDWSQPNNFASLPSSSASSSAIPFQSFSDSSSSPSSSSSASSSTSSFHSFNTFSPSFAEVLPSFPVPRTGPNFFTLPPEVDYYNPAIHPHRFNSMEGEASSTLAHLPLRMPDQNRPYILVKGNTAMGLYITSMNQSFLDLFGFTWVTILPSTLKSLLFFSCVLFFVLNPIGGGNSETHPKLGYSAS